MDNNSDIDDFDTFNIPELSTQFERSPMETSNLLNEPFQNRNATRAIARIDREIEQNRQSIQDNTFYLNQTENLIAEARRNNADLSPLITLHNQFSNRIERIRDGTRTLRRTRRTAVNSEWVLGYNTDFGIYPLR